MMQVSKRCGPVRARETEMANKTCKIVREGMDVVTAVGIIQAFRALRAEIEITVHGKWMMSDTAKEFDFGAGGGNVRLALDGTWKFASWTIAPTELSRVSVAARVPVA